MSKRPSLPRKFTLRVGVFVSAMALLAITTVNAEASPPDFSTLLLNHAYARLFTTVGLCKQASDINSLTGTQLSSKLSQLENAYVHIDGQSANFFFLGRDCMGTGTTTLASKLVAGGKAGGMPGVMLVSNYRNGSLVSQAAWDQPLNFGEATNLETNAPLAILTYWPGNFKPNITGNDAAGVARLTAPVTASTTAIQVKAPSGAKPYGAPDTWPYVNSRGTGLLSGAHSTDTHNFVSWVRIDNEIMQIITDPTLTNNVISLTVRRGIWGTTAATHVQGARVLAPAYVGNKNSSKSDVNYNGSPLRDDVNFPLRYGIKIWTPQGAGWIADRIEATFDSDGGFQGYNAIWLDVSSCFIYNLADPLGNQMWPWDDANGTKMSVAQWGTDQKAKVATLRSRFPGVALLANNFIRRPPGFDAVDACNTDLAPSWDGVDLEHWLNGLPDFTTDWTRSMEQNFDIQVNDVPAMYWVRTDRAYAGDPTVHRRFAYASFLLAYRPTATSSQFGSQWGLKVPEQYFYWDWGAPLASPTGIDQEAVGNGLYRRDFTNAVVLANPTSSSIAYNLGGTYYDVIHKDANGNPSPVTSVTVQPQDAAFLLRG